MTKVDKMLERLESADVRIVMCEFMRLRNALV